jgi:hypothetical protein
MPFTIKPDEALTVDADSIDYLKDRVDTERPLGAQLRSAAPGDARRRCGWCSSSTANAWPA